MTTRAAVALQLQDVLAGVGGGRREIQRKAAVEHLALRIAKLRSAACRGVGQIPENHRLRFSGPADPRLE